MQKIILYSALGLVLTGAIIFGGLYVNGRYNDKSQISESFNQEDTNLNKGVPGNDVMKKEEAMVKVDEMKKMGDVVIKKDDAVIKTEAKTVENKIVKSGSFNKIDPAHYASGDIKISGDENYYYINMQENFSSANGPDLFVYLSSPQEYKNIAVGGVDTSKTLNIGKLKSVSGAQSYRVSKAEFEKYNDSVIIWCKDFGIQFSRAELR